MINVISRQPEPPAHAAPLLFVHGAWHGAWCWDEYFLPHFAAKGFAAYALDLRGHGGSGSDRPLNLLGTRHYVADVTQVAADIEAERGQRPVLLGHSMGGYVIQKVLEHATAPAVVLVASVPVAGNLPWTLRHALRYPLIALKTLLTFNSRHSMATPELVRWHFYSPTIPPDQLQRYWALLGSESLRMMFDAGIRHRPRPQRTHPAPMLVLAAEHDAQFTLREQRATARAYNAELVIFPEMAHNMMLEPGWEAVADRIIAWLAALGM